MDLKIPLFDTDFGEEEVEAVALAIRSGWLTMGERVKKFESDFAGMLEVKHAIAVSNCTVALHLANEVLRICPGDQVICPSLTFVATASAIRYSGATPVFADVSSLDAWMLSVETIDTVKTERTKAICVVHYAGFPCPMDEICDYAKTNNLHIVEDCAHAPGVRYSGKFLGGWGNIGCFSFFSNKNLSTGEGGMLTTNNDEIAKKIRLLRSHGMTTLTLDRHKGHAFSYDVLETGYNYRPTEITAALGMVQLNKLKRKNEARRKITETYRKLLQNITPEIYVPFRNFSLTESAAHIMPVLLPDHVSRQAVMESMRSKGIQTSIHYRPIHTFSAYDSEKNKTQLPLTEKIGRQMVTLPLYPQMGEGDIEYVVESLSSVLKKQTLSPS